MQQIFRDPQRPLAQGAHHRDPASPGGRTELVSRLAAQVTPTTVLMSPDQGLIERVEGGMDAKTFLLTFEFALIGMGAPSVRRRPGRGPYAWLGYANHLFSTGNEPEECLAAYLWVLDSGDTKLPGLRARILEFLLKRIAYLKVSSDNAAPASSHAVTESSPGSQPPRPPHRTSMKPFASASGCGTSTTPRTSSRPSTGRTPTPHQGAALLQDLEWVVAYATTRTSTTWCPTPWPAFGSASRRSTLGRPIRRAPPEAGYGYTEEQLPRARRGPPPRGPAGRGPRPDGPGTGGLRPGQGPHRAGVHPVHEQGQPHGGLVHRPRPGRQGPRGPRCQGRRWSAPASSGSTASRRANGEIVVPEGGGRWAETSVPGSPVRPLLTSPSAWPSWVWAGVRALLLLAAGPIDLQSDEANYVHLALTLDAWASSSTATGTSGAGVPSLPARLLRPGRAAGWPWLDGSRSSPRSPSAPRPWCWVSACSTVASGSWPESAGPFTSPSRPSLTALVGDAVPGLWLPALALLVGSLRRMRPEPLPPQGLRRSQRRRGAPQGGALYLAPLLLVLPCMRAQGGRGSHPRSHPAAARVRRP